MKYSRAYNSGLTRLLLATLLAGSSVLSGCEFGVQGGVAALSSKFTGIVSVSATSPSSVQVNWKSQPGYSSYTVYSSSSDHPLVTLKTGTSFTASGLAPNTAYSFSVVGTAADGSQYGSAKQMQATTWSNFLGPASASATDSQSVTLAWTYNIGPSFQVYYAAGAAPSITTGVPAVLKPAQFVTSSPSGYTVGGLSANTTYYFMAVAKYPDGTDSFQNAQSASTPLTAQYFILGGLGVLPVITTPSSVLNTTPPIFNVSNSLNTYTTTFKLVNPDGVSTTTVGAINGSGSVTSTQTFTAGIKIVIITTTDTFTGQTASSEFSAINVATALPNNGLRVVSATTPSSLSPLPTISNNPISLGPFPVFTIAGAQPSYTTTIYKGIYPAGTPIGTIVGSGQIKTATSAPLAQGLNTLYAIVTANGQTATINNIQVRIKSIDAAPVPAPAMVNGGVGNQGFGRSLAVGDFNCDGRPDLAVGAPNGNGVFVYYGTATGLDFSVAPDPAPLAGTTKPLYIPVQPGWASYYTGTQVGTGNGYSAFGVTLAAANFNGDFNLAANKPCSDLAIAATGAFNTSLDKGVITIYYGSPTGLQTGAPLENSLTCIGAGSNSCSPAYMKYWTAGIPMGNTTANFIYYYNEGMGAALAVGDLDGDGYDDLVGSMPRADPDILYGENGMVLLWKGTANGLSPAFTKLRAPASLIPAFGAPTSTGLTNFGMQLAIGHFITSPRGTFPPGPGNLPPGPADLAISFRALDAGVGGLSNPTSQSGLIVATGPISVDATSHISSPYYKITPPNCNRATPVALPAGWSVGAATCANLPNSLVAMDINGDGWDDLVFSDASPLTPAGTFGAVYVYYGSSSVADFIAQGAQSTVPSPGNTCPDLVTGKCNKPQVFYRSDTGMSDFGSSVANLGDVNGDGYPDLGVGAYMSTSGAALSSGFAYIYRGSANGIVNSLTTAIKPGKPANAFFGTAMAGARFSSLTGFADLYTNPPPGALTHTFNDVTIGAVGESPANRDPIRKIATVTGGGVLGSQAQGTVSIYSNQSPGFSASLSAPTTVLAPTNTISSDLQSDQAALVGDINQDGFSDAVIKVQVPAAYKKSLSFTVVPMPLSQTQIGFVIYYGSANGFITTNVVGGITTLIPPSYNPVRATDPLFVSNTQIKGTGFNDPGLATSLGAAGDMNGDGFADVFTANSYGYESVIFYGSSTGLIVAPTPKKSVFNSGNRPSLDPTILSLNYTTLPVAGIGASSGPMFLGTRYAFGDFNGDGYGDLAFMAYYGNITVIYGSSWGAVTDGDLWDATAYPANYATAIRSNQASFTPSCVNQPFGAGGPGLVCYPLTIAASGDPAAATTPFPVNQGPSSIVSAGDMDGDGTDDLISVNSIDSTWFKGAGTVSIYYGSKTQGIDPNIFVNLQIPVASNTAAGAYLSSRFLGGPWVTWSAGFSGGYGRGYDINGDGLADFLITSAAENNVIVIYGLSGPGSSPTSTSGAYIQQGYCASYPCYPVITAVGAPDYQANHVLTVSALQPNSCSPALRSCNIMRFNLPVDNLYIQDEIFGVSDITGDPYGDVVLSRGNVYNPGNSNSNLMYIYSGSASGLQVIGTPTLNPNCIAGICDPTLIKMPQTLPQTPAGSLGITWYSATWMNPQDVDGDGKKDFLISSPDLNALDPAGNLMGTNTGGLFLFH